MLEFIGPNELMEYINRRNVLIIDVRDKEAYLDHHIVNAVNIPYDVLVNGRCNLNKRNPVILYCDRGNTSLKAGVKLSSHGYSVMTLAGGIEGLREYLNTPE